VLATLGGLALFLLGIGRIASALQAMAGPATRRWMARATRSPWRALAAGTGVSALTQSGTASAVTALGLVATGLVAVREGIALSLGAKLGATLAIQLAAFRIGDYALAMIAFGFALTLWRPAREPGGLVLGAGLLFLGLSLTVQSLGALQGGELFTLVLEAAERQPLAVAALGALLGVAVSSANASAAVALGLFVAGAVTLPTALALVVGGNVGSTVLPILAARELDVHARRVAIMHLAVKGAGALAVLAVLPLGAQAVALLGGDGARQIANAHTLFNLAVGVLGTLVAGPLALLAARALPDREESMAPKYLRSTAMDDAPLATALALRETVRISDHVGVMTELAVASIRNGQWDSERLEAHESKVDRLTYAVVDYLARLRRKSGLSDVMSERLLLTATELEHLGDQIRRLNRREDRLRASGVEFSRDGRAELADTGERVLTRMRASFTALATGDRTLARSVIEGRPDVERFVARMRLAHLARLEAQLPESRASSGHHLEVLTLLRQVDASVTRVAGWVVEGVASIRPEVASAADDASDAAAGTGSRAE
jgi:phosphate:Na+ symporter